MGKKQRQPAKIKEKQPDPEVPVNAKRRLFTAAYKVRILAEADRCEQHGGIGELLRREGLYSSHLTTWRRQRSAGQLQALSPQKRGPKKDEQVAELATLRRENERLRAQLAQAELIITAQKKLSQALETVLNPETEENSL
jgi:transposase-like protein